MDNFENLYTCLLKIRVLGGSIVHDINALIWGLLIVLEFCNSHSSKVCRIVRMTSNILIEDLIGAGEISGDAKDENDCYRINLF